MSTFMEGEKNCLIVCYEKKVKRINFNELATFCDTWGLYRSILRQPGMDMCCAWSSTRRSSQKVQEAA